ncbi:MAG: hypothetical protein M3083_01745 [Actinomycetota bacterium]|nr:hypothetical protein [Actinomycetota bacterium]
MTCLRGRWPAVALAVAVLSLGVAGCTSNDNGGVIYTPPPSTTTSLAGNTATS